jgi:hypothetical protein
MKRNYATEIAELPGTYQRCLASEAADEVANVVLRPGPTIFVGSGGALAVARLAADLHISTTGDLAVAMTPLEAVSANLASSCGLVLFTASGKHPDAALALQAARARGASHLGIVSGRTRDELPASLTGLDVCIATVPSPPDGFLATNSVLAMATLLCRAHGATLPTNLPEPARENLRALRRSTIAIAGPLLGAVAVDLETRLSETGLSFAQTTDFRNVAHGRHVGLLRNVDDVTVVAIADDGSKALAARTSDLLPSDTDVRRMESPLRWPESVVDLLAQSMRIVGATGESQALDPGRPGVAPFGRRLYHLPVARLLESRLPNPVDRKARQLPGVARSTVEAAYHEWREGVAGAPIGAVILDYDGTCCPTWDRFRPPPVEVQSELTRLIESGIVVGFASGRGRSIHADTRSWLPEPMWAAVHVGLYNGSCILRLSDDPADYTGCDGELAAIAERLESIDVGDVLKVERRRTQVSVAAADGRTSGESLLPTVRAVMARSPELHGKAFASAHAVDIVADGAGKVAVLSEVAAAVEGSVLAIGDQGQADGNDFELLAATPMSLSVDRCSADLTRCWNLDDRGEGGPRLLVRYLKAIRVRQGVALFGWA